jgi:hypothetical protein
VRHLELSELKYRKEEEEYGSDGEVIDDEFEDYRPVLKNLLPQIVTLIVYECDPRNYDLNKVDFKNLRHVSYHHSEASYCYFGRPGLERLHLSINPFLDEYGPGTEELEKRVAQGMIKEVVLWTDGEFKKKDYLEFCDLEHTFLTLRTGVWGQFPPEQFDDDGGFWGEDRPVL